MVQPARSWTKIDHLGNVIDSGSLEVTWEQVRKSRDRILQKTDWRAVKDRTMSQAWKDYRQALRDITDHASANDAADNWPQPPE